VCSGEVAGVDGKVKENGQLVTVHSRYVSFYFTNFPAQLSLFYLRKGFEVCGILEDIYVAKKPNMQGKPYGFVKYSNIRDIIKLEKALNAVCFGHFRVSASVACFDRAARKLVSLGNKGVKKATVTNDGDIPAGGGTLESKQGDGLILTDALNGVRVGNVMVPLGGRKEKVSCDIVDHQAITSNLQDDVDTARDKGHVVYLRKYRSVPDDVEWASKGVVATVSNGEAIPMVRRRVADAGFSDVEITHLGADKVFVRSMAGSDTVSLLERACEFFNLIFSYWERWKEKAMPFQRGAWVHL
jgi:hypothetical protein